MTANSPRHVCLHLEVLGLERDEDRPLCESIAVALGAFAEDRRSREGTWEPGEWFSYQGVCIRTYWQTDRMFGAAESELH